MSSQRRGTFCKLCEQKISRYDESLFCDGECNGTYHNTCVNLSLENITDMKENNEISKWKCKNCKETDDSINTNKNMSKSDSNNVLSEGKQNLASNLNAEEKLDYIIKYQIEMSAKIDDLSQKLDKALQIIDAKNAEIIVLQQDVADLKQAKPVAGPKLYSIAAQQPKMDYLPSPQQVLVPQRRQPGNSKNKPVIKKVVQLGSQFAKNVDDIASTSENPDPMHIQPLAVSTESSENVKETIEIGDDGEFTKVSYKKPRKKIVRGTGPILNNGLNCVESKIWIFLGRCARASTVEDVSMHLKENFPEKVFDITDLESKGIFKSYRIGASVELKDVLFDPTSWPKGALITRYFFRRNGSQRGTGALFANSGMQAER